METPRSGSFIIISITGHYSFFLSFDTDSLAALVVSLTFSHFHTLSLSLSLSLPFSLFSKTLPTLGNLHYFRG